jgi:2-methylcitrate dehydratase PrpD
VDWRTISLPAEVARVARLHFLDALGVGLAASALPESGGWSKAACSPGSATVFGGGGGRSAALAAMANGAMIHALEYDDTHIASVVHGSSVAAPVALAAAQAAGADGKTLLAGYVLAWEVMIRLGLAAPGAWQANGFQVTSAAGAVGAAAAAALIAGLDEQQALAAVGIAGSQASGLLEFLSDGSSVKALNPGWAAHTGLIAVDLARAGMTGPATVLNGRYGLLSSLARAPEAAERLDGHLATLGTTWHLLDAAFKLYPCCHYIHPFLEALERLMADSGLAAGQLDKAVCHVAPPQAPLICEPWARRQSPLSGYDAKWALAYCLAARLALGPLTVESFARTPDPDVVALARRFEWTAMPNHGFPARFPARLTVTTGDGAVLEANIETVRGAPGRPIGEADVLAKFRANAALALPSARAAALEDAAMAVDTPSGVALMSAALSEGAAV